MTKILPPLRSTALCALGLALLASSSLLAKDVVKVIFDDTFDFSSLKTFDFDDLENDNRGPMFDEAVAVLRRVATEELSAKGFRRDRENPDFLILFNGRMADAVELIGGYRYGVGKYGVWETYAGPGWSRSTSQGLIILYMHTPGAEEPFWGGGFFTELPGTVGGKLLKKTLTKAAKRLVKQYPPG